MCEKLALVLAFEFVVLGSDCSPGFVAVVVRGLMLTRSVEPWRAEESKVDGGKNMAYRTQDTEYRDIRQELELM